MRKIVQTEFESRYFDLFGECLLKSFMTYNPDWSFHVLDFGLTTKQRAVVERFGTLEPATMEVGNRWSTIKARVRAVDRLLDDADVVMHIDGDVLVTGVLEDAVDLLHDSGCHAGYMPTWMRFYQHVRNRKVLESLVPAAQIAEIGDRSTLAGSFFVVEPCDDMQRVFRFVIDNWDKLRATLYTEESAMLCGHVVCGVPYVSLDWCYNWPVDRSDYFDKMYVVPADVPIAPDTADPLRSVHFSNVKWESQNVAGPGFMAWHAWNRIMQTYKDIPWERFEESCRSS